MGNPRILNRQVAGDYNSPLTVHMPIFGTDMFRLTSKDATLMAQGGGTSYRSLEIYLDLLSDNRIQTDLSKQTGEICSRPLIIEPGTPKGQDPTDDDLSAAAFCEDVIHSLQEPAVDELLDYGTLPGDQSFDTLTRHLLTAVVTNISTAELIWRRDSYGRAVIDRAIGVDPRRWQFEQSLENDHIYPKLMKRTDTYRGDFIPPRKFIFHRHWSVYGGDFLGLGYGGPLYWLIQWKREALTFWLSLIDRYADPALLGTKPKNAVEADIQSFESALNKFSRETNMIMTEGFKIDTLKVDPAKGVDLVRGLVNYCDDEISLLLTGENVTGQQSGQSTFGGPETVANSIRLMKAKAWSDELNLTLRSTFLNWLTKLNYPKANVPKISRQFQGLTDILEVARAYKELGYQVDRAYLESATGIPMEPEKEAPKAPKIPPGIL